ncbi:rhodanese-like domain-containing protein [Lutibacter sp. B2]|nr:rhodanese-like domain-containing protein [Lutibacter sp. B2]
MTKLNAELTKYFDDLKNDHTNLISSEILSEKIEAKEDMFLLDIRRKEDYDKEHIEGAFHAEWNEVGEFIEDDVFTKDEPVVVICYTGQTAGQIVGVLKSTGYNACSLKGGMLNGWLKDAMPVKASCDT